MDLQAGMPLRRLYEVPGAVRKTRRPRDEAGNNLWQRRASFTVERFGVERLEPSDEEILSL
jgi:hypothetical protein